MVRFIGAVLVLDGCADLVSVLCLTYWVKKAKRGLEAIYDEARYEAAAIEAEGRIRTSPSREAEQNKKRPGRPAGRPVFSVKEAAAGWDPLIAPMLSGVKSKKAQSANAPCENQAIEK